jgi:hypothetical protein
MSMWSLWAHISSCSIAAARKGELGEFIASELTGARFRSLDVRRVMRAQTFERRKLARDFKARLRQEGYDL